MTLPLNDDDLLEVDTEKLPEDQQIAFRDTLIQRWEERKAILELAQEDEDKLRLKIVELLWTPGVLSGKENIPLYNGYRLEIEKGINYNVDQQTVRMFLDKIASTGEAGKLLADRIMKWKASLSLTEYNKLDEINKAIINGCITKTSAKPTVKIIAPKAKASRAVGKEGAGF